MKKDIDEVSTWVISANTLYYDVIKAFEELNEIEWRQSSKMQVGDIVFIYLAKPYSQIKYKCRVMAIDIPESELTIDDSKYQLNLESPRYKKYARLKLIRSYEKNGLTLATMKNRGITFQFQGPIRAKGELYNLLNNLD